MSGSQSVAAGLLFGAAVGLSTCAVAASWRRVRVSGHEAGLKREMVTQGFTADDIARVLRAG